MKLIKLVVLFMSMLLPTMSQAMDYIKPQLLEDKFYKEYWEQHFLFDDGTFVTAQFLAANFPWPVGNAHGIMVANVVSPDGKRTIIKNGRSLGEWGFDSEKFNLFIHTHRLKKDGNHYDIYLGSDEGNEVKAVVSSEIQPFDHKKFTHKKTYMETSVYLPFFEGSGKWQLYQGENQPFKTGEGKVQGFATHTLMTGRLENMLTDWLRVSGLRASDNQPLPFLSAIERPDGSREFILLLKDEAGNITKFSDVTIDYKQNKKAKNGSAYPTLIKIAGKNGKDSLVGTIRLSRKIDHFNIYDHLNFFERSFAMSRASVANYRYIADYDLTYATGHEIKILTGKALSEYQDILGPKKRKKTKRRGGR